MGGRGERRRWWGPASWPPPPGASRVWPSWHRRGADPRGPPAGGQRPAQLPRLLAQGRFGVPALHQEDVVDAGPVVLGIQIAGYVGHMMPTPGEDHDQDQLAAILAMVPMNVAMQWTKALIERAGHAYAATPEAILPEPMVNGR
jgi:hypothetical protein